MAAIIKPIYVGYNVNGNYVKEAEILRSNGIAEKVFVDKLPDKPYTWMANVLGVSIGSIGGVPIAPNVRAAYAANRAITLPKVLLDMPLADANSLMLEVHRNVWKNIISNQEIMCKYCGELMKVDIDLNKIEVSEEDLKKSQKEYLNLVCNVTYGWDFVSPGDGERKLYPEQDGYNFNQFIFRIPTIGDGILNEKYCSDAVVMWRRIALSTLIEVNSVDKDGRVVNVLPGDAVRTLGIRVFNELLDGKDLSDIRNCLREELPTIPYFYEDECVHCHRQTPVSMEGTNFFSA